MSFGFDNVSALHRYLSLVKMQKLLPSNNVTMALGLVGRVQFYNQYVNILIE